MGQFAASSGAPAKTKRKPRGKPFQKGQSGNPAGTTKERAEFLAIVRSHTPEAIACLVREVNSSGDHRITAAVKILEWGLGKPAQAVEDREAMTQASRPFAAIAPEKLLSIIDAIDEDDEPGEN